MKTLKKGKEISFQSDDDDTFFQTMAQKTAATMPAVAWETDKSKMQQDQSKKQDETLPYSSLHIMTAVTSHENTL